MDQLSRRPGGYRGPRFRKQGGASGGSSRTRTATDCTRCGYSQHNTGKKCPAAEVSCHRCGRKGHFSSRCFSKITALSEVDPTFQDTSYLDAVNDSSATWMVTLKIKKIDVQFKVDTGAGVTAITEGTYITLQKPKLTPASKTLCGPAQQSLEILRCFQEQLAYQDRCTNIELFVIKDLKNNLLGLPAIMGLQLMEKLCATELKNNAVQDQFPQVFSGLGTFGEEHKINLKADSTPFSLYAPRNVPVPLLPKVKQELYRMLSLGVIRKVSEPTPWCAGMVVVPKKSGAIRICVNLKLLNECVLREVYPIPTVDDTVAQLAGARVFSKLDVNSGFWQIPLEEQSQLLTTFITPFGRFCFNKLPFGISSASEVYQKCMNQILEGLLGVLCLIYDVLIFAQNQEEHDLRLQETLKRLQLAGVTLNAEKCAFGQRSLKFLGHIIDEQGIRADPDKTSAVLTMSTPKSVTDVR